MRQRCRFWQAVKRLRYPLTPHFCFQVEIVHYLTGVRRGGTRSSLPVAACPSPRRRPVRPPPAHMPGQRAWPSNSTCQTRAASERPSASAPSACGRAPWCWPSTSAAPSSESAAAARAAPARRCARPRHPHAYVRTAATATAGSPATATAGPPASLLTRTSTTRHCRCPAGRHHPARAAPRPPQGVLFGLCRQARGGALQVPGPAAARGGPGRRQRRRGHAHA